MDELAAAYEGLEGDLADAEEVATYRRAMLERSDGQADFLAPLLPARAQALEVGAGNGRLLIELYRRGAIAGGLGVDLARSRIEFAQRWAADEGASDLRFVAGDALALDLGERVYDVALCITGALSYFDPVEDGAALRLVRRMGAALRPGGLLVLEVYLHPRTKALIAAAGEDRVRIWHELPEDDPWRFYLSEMVLEDGILTHHKTFIHRTTGEVDSGRRERLRLYTPGELEELVGAAGFTGVRLYDRWSGRPYSDGHEIVVTARLPA